MGPLTAARLSVRILHESTRTPTGCRVLAGHVPQPNGYQVVYWRDEHGAKAREYVHRLAFMLWHGPIPEGLVVAHTCDNPPCFEPTHLRAKTQAENLGDMIERGRSNRGERHWNWKGGTSDNYRTGRNRQRA